jgi:hypothetical protein
MPIERILFTIDGLRRHWLLFLLPLLVAGPIAILMLQFAPVKYEAKSTILMTSANRGPEWAGGAAGIPRQSAIEQIAVLEAWLKSDQVLGELLPQLYGELFLPDTEQFGVVTAALRRSLTLELVGAAVLEIRLEAAQGKGLGRKLEIIISRLLEGVLNPEAGILSASQMIIARRGDAVEEADNALTRAIEAANLRAPVEVKSRLQVLHELKKRGLMDAKAQARKSENGDGVGALARPTGEEASGSSKFRLDVHSEQIIEARAAVSTNEEVVTGLERLFETYENARLSYREARVRAGAPESIYVRVFDAPERLTVIGRPRDPFVGVSSGRKYAIAIMLLACLSSLGSVGLAVLLDKKLMISEDFENIAEIPVVARLPRLAEKV